MATKKTSTQTSSTTEAAARKLAVPAPAGPAPEFAEGCDSTCQDTYRVLGSGVFPSNNTRKTDLNNNDLIIGSTGSGKTRTYIKPNLLQGNESMIITDTKGNLEREVGPALRKLGYAVQKLDFTQVGENLGYNPFDFVYVDPDTGAMDEQDIMRIAHALCPIEDTKDPFWENAACMLIAALVAYIMESSLPRDRNLCVLSDLLTQINDGRLSKLMDELAAFNPKSLAVQKYRAFMTCQAADKMLSSIVGIAAVKLDTFVFDGAKRMYTNPMRVDFRRLAQTKTALFLTVSDVDRSMDRMVNLLYAQALIDLCRFADRECKGSCLPQPVRLYLDDFAAASVIPDFDNIISVIRSRGIATSIILQSITQLEGMYGDAKASTIMANCSHVMYLGGHDIGTTNVMAELANCMPDRISRMPRGRVFVYEDGKGGKVVDRYPLEQHPRYELLREAQELRAQEAKEPAVQ